MQNETLNVLLTRRSVRKYKPDQVDPETLNAILEAGTYAPSGMGKQPSVIVAVQSPEDRKAVMELNKKEEQKALGTPVRNGAEKSNAGDDDPGTPPEFDKSDE